MRVPVDFKNSSELFDRAVKLMPGGVNSPVRAFGAVGADPVYIDHANGSKLYSSEGKEYIDYMMSWGPLILGHANMSIISSITEAAVKGTSFGANHRDEIRLAELIINNMPTIEMLRLVNSGTEATMSALRLARAATGRDKVVKFRGCYHGHSDSFLISAGSGALTHGTPSSPGVTKGAAQDTLLADYNDIESVKRCFESNQGDIAAVIVEPVAGNMGLVPPVEGFLAGLREECDKYGALLIFDEVITGFRLGLGGAAEMFDVEPDITTLGKIIGGGLPVGAYGGKKELLEQVSPSGGVYQAGTLSGNPLACAAGIKMLEILTEEKPYELLNKMCQALVSIMEENIADSGVKACINRVGSAFTIFFGVDSVTGYNDAMAADTDMFAAYFRGMLERGIYIPPAQYEANFLSTAHTVDDLEFTLVAQKEVLETLK